MNMFRKWSQCLPTVFITIICVNLYLFYFKTTYVCTSAPLIQIQGKSEVYADESHIDLDFISQLSEDDPKLIKIIQHWFLESPSPPSVPYAFENKNPNLNGQVGQPLVIDNILNQKRNGFFIECGAYDGEGYSNTLLFELERNWTGLLIEPNYKAFKDLKEKQRKAYILNGCLSGSNRAKRLDFVHAAMVGGLKDISVPQNIEAMRTEGQVPSTSKTSCFPLYSLLLAVGNPKVDFFSLDVEGAEWDIIQSVPWNKVDITLLMVENAHLGEDNAKMEEFMINQGYEIKERLGGQDIIFQKKS